ncbi:serine hydrolase domain-containing protein [Microbulbifer pacificus]|uniref:serine hydrolase domain-containing protein n=1 Tax=Microbulbifer pacificus TaxID=407164 RepID=UPI001319F66C|nr:serine hydrolase [Microbulbifer pacificus]
MSTLALCTAETNAQAEQDRAWRFRQVAANFSFQNEAAPIHFRQLQNLYPNRKIESAHGAPLPLSKAPLETDLITYRYKDKESTLQEYLTRRRTTGFLVLKDGKIAHESYFYGNSERAASIIFSASKSVISLLVGIAFDQGLLKNVDDPITDYLPELKGSAFDGASIKNVLQMTTSLYIEGANHGVNEPGRDIRNATAISLAYGQGDLRTQPKTAKRKPGKMHGQTWEYLNTNTQALTVLVERVSGLTVSEFAAKHLWRRIGTEQQAFWLTDRTDDAQAIEHGYMGFIASLRDLGRLGMMLANEGRWEGQQVVSSQWLKESTTNDNPAVTSVSGHTIMDYGYQWWLPRGDAGEFMAVGIGGQFIYGNPSQQVVIVQTSADPQYNSLSKEESVYLYRAIVSALSSDTAKG